MFSVKELLRWMTDFIPYHPETNRFLEAELLLAYVLKIKRERLHAYPERLLTNGEYEELIEFFKRWNLGEPIAYLTGKREFWSLDLKVTKDTLIPRPETELLVESALAFGVNHKVPQKIADLGTGSGAVALALAKEKPDWTIYATDISHDALAVAEENAERLKLSQIIFSQGCWCEALPALQFDLIVSNPPYLATDELRSELTYEPRSALEGGVDGLKDIRHIIVESCRYLKQDSYLMLEHGYAQAEKVRSIFAEVGYNDITTKQDLSGLERVTFGRWMN